MPGMDIRMPGGMPGIPGMDMGMPGMPGMEMPGMPGMDMGMPGMDMGMPGGMPQCRVWIWECQAACLKCQAWIGQIAKCQEWRS